MSPLTPAEKYQIEALPKLEAYVEEQARSSGPSLVVDRYLAA